jgi:hypothetical protein
LLIEQPGIPVGTQGTVPGIKGEAREYIVEFDGYGAYEVPEDCIDQAESA